MKSKKVEIMGKVFAAASIVAIAPTSMAAHQESNKSVIRAADASVAASCSLADILAGICSDDGNSWS